MYQKILFMNMNIERITKKKDVNGSFDLLDRNEKQQQLYFPNVHTIYITN